MFTMTLSPVELLVRVFVIYAVVFALLRLSGKKHIGEMAPFDLVVLLILSECVQNAIVADDTSITAAAIAVGALIALSQAVGYLTWRSKTASRLLEGTPRVLVRNGRVNNDVLANEQITRTELMEALRREGCTCLTNIRFAVLENDGDITVAERRKRP